MSATIFRFGLFEADIVRNTLTRNGVRTKVQDQPFRALILLLERSGEIVTREELRQKLWPEGTHVDFDGSLNVIVKKLRAAIDDDSDNPCFIETVPRRGYRFIAPVATNVTDVRPAATTPAEPDPGEIRAATAGFQQSNPKRSSRYLVHVLSVLLLLAGGGGVWFVWQRNHSSNKVPPKLAAQTAAVPIRKSVAVLGFQNISGRSDDAWLATAFSEMLSTELAGGERLRLVSGQEVANLQHSSLPQQGATLDQATASHIGAALSSDFLVLGSYTTVGKAGHGQLRLDVRLQEVKTGEILAEVAETGDRDDIFQITSRVGARLRNQLGVPSLGELDDAGVLASLPLDREAARFYSLGLARLRAFDASAARDLLEQASRADPKFALAHAMLARAWARLGYQQQHKDEAKKALDLSTDLPPAERMLVEADYYESVANHEKAVSTYHALFQLFPDNVEYGLQLAVAQGDAGHGSEALETLAQLRRLPPPASNDPNLDLTEGNIRFRRDAEASDRLYHAAATKAKAQGKNLIYAKAEQAICFANGKRSQVPQECREAYERFLAAGNRDEAASCLQLMAETNRLTGHDQDAVPLYEQAIRELREVGDPQKIGIALNNLSLVLENEGQWELAEQDYREARRDFQTVSDKANTSIATANIADIQAMRGHLPEAAALYRQVWELADSSGRARHEYPHIQFASLLLMRGELEPAQREVEAQVNSLRAYGGDPWQLANALTVLGDIEKAKGDLDDAGKNYQEALEHLKKQNSSLASEQVSLAELFITEGHADAAETLLHGAIAELEADKSAGNEIGGYQSLARALLAEGKIAEAQGAITHAFKLADLRQFPVIELPLRLVQARVSAAAARPGQAGRSSLNAAAKLMRDLIQRSQQLGLYSDSCEARLALGEVELKINPVSGRAQLTTLATEARNRGFELLARQAEQAVAGTSNASDHKTTP